MDFAYYRNFITIVEAGNLTAAAQKLNLAQPALSTQLKILEQDYGAKLIKTKRGIRRLELTDAGKLFYERAKYLCSIEESTRMELQNRSTGVAGTLKISLSPARAPLFVKRYIKPFRELYPDVHYQIHEVDVNAQVLHILDGLTDIAVTNAPLPEPQRFKVVLSQKDRFIVVARKNVGYQEAGSNVQLKDLSTQPLCTNFGSYPMLNAAFMAEGFKPQFVCVSTTRTTALQFAEQMMGVAVIPAEDGESFDKKFLVKTLAENELFVLKTIFISKHKQLSAVAEKFLTFYKEEYFKNIDKK